MEPSDQDLHARARIRKAALNSYAEVGPAATSVRRVAKAAGVSPGLVQHYFPTKEALREDVNDHVLSTAASYFSDLADLELARDPIEELGRRVAAHIHDNPSDLLYVSRSIAEGDEQALNLFDGFVALVDSQWERLSASELLREDLDRPWAALHVVVLNLGSVLFQAAVGRHLAESFSSAEGLRRWSEASAALFQRGLYQTGYDQSPRARVNAQGAQR